MKANNRYSISCREVFETEEIMETFVAEVAVQ
jgi:hypothetical protein